MAKRKGFALKFDPKMLQEIRTDYRVRADLVKRAERIAEAAGGEDMGYKVTDLVLEDPRAAASVMATGKAHFHNRKHAALIRSLGAGRD